MNRRIVVPLFVFLLQASCAKTPQTPPPDAPQAPTNVTPTTHSADAVSAPTQPANCVDDAAFVADLTLPDGSQAAPGDDLTKQWSVQNTGTCDWGPDYRLVPILPNPLAKDSPVGLYPARAGTQAVWQATIQVPEIEGEVIGRWQAQDPDGVAFGQEVYVVLEVTPATALPPAASPTP